MLACLSCSRAIFTGSFRSSSSDEWMWQKLVPCHASESGLIDGRLQHLAPQLGLAQRTAEVLPDGHVSTFGFRKWHCRFGEKGARLRNKPPGVSSSSAFVRRPRSETVHDADARFWLHSGACGGPAAACGLFASLVGW